MKFRTTIQCDKYPFEIKYSDCLFFIGSCFSNQISQKLDYLRYNVLQNPAGITFNPVSITRTIRSIFLEDSLPEEDFIFHNEQWCHPDFHSIFNNVDKATFKGKLEESIKTAKSFLENADYLFITLGTAFVYKSHKSGEIVNNCHKLPSAHFERKLLEVREIKEALDEIRGIVKRHSKKDPQFILTLSPVRHIKDGLIQNQLSKARCLCAIHEITKKYDDVFYFPSYEILLDDLRDYRFYNEDLIHPSPQAVSYIFEIFKSVLLSEDEQVIRKQVQTVQNNLAHKAFNPQSDAHQKFLKATQEKMELIKTKYGISF